MVPAQWAQAVQPANYPATARALHATLFERAITVDVRPAWLRLDGSDLVVVPGLYLVSDDTGRTVGAFGRRAEPCSSPGSRGSRREANTVRTGGHPGAFRDLLGAWSEE